MVRIGSLRTRRNPTQRAVEVVQSHTNAIGIDAKLRRTRVDLRIFAMQRAERGFRTERFQIRASKAGSSLSEVLQNGGIGSRNPRFGVDSEDFQTRFEVWEVEKHLAIESSGASKRWIDGIDAIGRSDDDDLAARVQSVH